MRISWEAYVSLGIFLSYQSCCLSVPENEDVNKTKSESLQPTSARKYVAVFDIDNTLCSVAYSEKDLEFAKKSQPDCPVIIWKHKSGNYPHVFIPYLRVLFDYLLEKGVRIAFFCTAVEERNPAVIPTLLTSFWGRKKFEALKAKGQFAMFSRDDLRPSHEGEEGMNKKDLKIVIREGESLVDTILVEDDPSYTASGQEPCLVIIDLCRWIQLKDKNNTDPVDSVYYMIGVFKTYFENSQYNKLPLREGIKQMNLPDCLEGDPCVRKMIDLGSSEVQSRPKNMRGIPKVSFLSRILDFCRLRNFG